MPGETGLDPAFSLLRAAAAVSGARAWAVGGYVRDHLLGRGHPDLDVVVEGDLSMELAAEFARRAGARPPVVFPRFGTAQVTWQGRLVEFAATRAESYHPDSRRPDVRPAGIDDDLRRRDFTVNTLLMDFDGAVEDRLGTGLADLRAGLLRTPLDPEATFSDDPLRMFRAVRFAAELGFELDAPLLPAMRRLRGRARPPVLSVERVAGELRRILVSPRPGLGVRLLEESGLLEEILPEVAACRGVAQGRWHTADVLGHTLQALDLAPPDLLTRLGVLMHDVGKPSSATPDGAFHGHETVGAELAAVALRRLRFSNAEVEAVGRLVQMHMRPAMYDRGWTDAAVRRLARDAGELAPRLLDLAAADVRASAYPDPGKVDELRARVDRARAEPARLRPQIDGRMLMEVSGLPPGPDLGRLKRELEDLIVDGRLDPDPAAVRAHLERSRREPGPG